MVARISSCVSFVTKQKVLVEQRTLETPKWGISSDTCDEFIKEARGENLEAFLFFLFASPFFEQETSYPCTQERELKASLFLGDTQ